MQSTDASHPSTVVSASEPHLLSPEHAHMNLPSLGDILGPPEPPKANPLPQPPAAQVHVYTMHSSSTPPIFQHTSPYVEAPIPSGVVYPDPPGRSKSRASVTRPSESTGDSPSLKSLHRKRQGSLADSLSGRLSPLSLGMPFSSFAVPDGR